MAESDLEDFKQAEPQIPPVLLVDARNLMYRAIFANKKGGGQIHHFTVMLRFMTGWIERFRPSAVCIFWDAKRETLWRRKVYEFYKVRDDSKYAVDIKEDLIYTQAAAKAIFEFLGVRQFEKPTMEADDLIYATCKILAPKPSIICSSDSDMRQIAFRMPHVKCFDPMNQVFTEDTDYDPAVQKALEGDSTDVVPGYTGIGPVKSEKMARCLEERLEFLAASRPADKKRGSDESGPKIYIRNLLLVDLSLCPELLKNQLYAQFRFGVKPVFDKKQAMDLAHKHKVNGFMTEFDKTASRFRYLADHQ